MLFNRPERTIRRLLIVEDEPLLAFDNEHFLSESGFRVVATVDRVAAARDVLASEPVDLVLADIELSAGDSGVEVAVAAVEYAVPVLFVTGSCPDEARRLAIGCLAKPYSHRTLRAAIDAIEARLSGREAKRLPSGLTLYEPEA